MTTKTQNAYWQRPYGVRLHARYFSGTFMFDTFAEAFDYACHQRRSAAKDGLLSDFQVTLTRCQEAVPAFLFNAAVAAATR